MKATKKREDDRLTVAVEGSIDVKSAPELKEELEGELEDISELVFDLTETSYTSSAGLRVFLGAYQTLSKRGGKMILKGVNPAFYDALEMAGFTHFLDIER